jgi:hypothetical protein
MALIMAALSAASLSSRETFFTFLVLVIGDGFSPTATSILEYDLRFETY